MTLGDADADDLTLSASSSAQGLVPDANIVLGGSGASRTVAVTPASNQSGSATITLTVSDGAASTTDTFVLTVDAVNDAPTISNVTNQQTNEDTATSALAVTLGDVETAVANLDLSGSSSNTTLVPDANIVLGGTGASRTVTVTPASNQSGSATITLTVSDGTASTTDTFVLTVGGVNDVPTISDVANQATNEDTATGELAVTLGDEETAAADLTLSVSSSAQGLVPDANIVLGGTGASRTVTVTPASNQSGSATITLTVSDGTASSTDTFVLTVDAVNDAPTISDVSSLSTNEDTATSALAVTLGDEETAAADLTLSTSSSAQGLVPDANIVLGGTGASRTVTVTPASNESGSATITLTVSDGAASTTDTFVLTVDAVNDVPTISDVANQATNEDTATGELAVTLGDEETAAADLTLSASSSAQGLVPDANIVLGGTGASRTVTVTPASNQSGSATITLTVSDGTASTTDTFVLTVDAVNDVPTISDVSSLSTNEDTATSALAVTLGDADADDLTLSASSSAQGLVPDANIVLGGTGASRTVTVTPASNQSGSATITLTVSDGAASTTDTFVLTVDAVNDAPTISNVTNQQTNEDTATSALAVTLGDEETAVADLTLSASSSAQGSVPDANIVLGGTGASRTVTVTPASNQSGSATITLTVSDGTASSTDTFVLTVDAVNDVPTISDVSSLSTNEDTATSALAVTLGDADADDLTLSASSSAQGLVPDANIVLGGSGASRTVAVTPASNQSGSATITLTVSDGAASTTDTFVLTVDAVNDAPTISNVTNQQTNEDTATSALAVTLGDVETAVANLDLSGSSSNTTLVPDANIVLGGTGASRTVTVTPASNQSGSATITLTVSDGTASSTDTFVLTVDAVNDVPTISDVSSLSTNEDTATSALAVTLGDADADDLTLSASSSAQGLVPDANIVLGGSGASRTVAVTPASNQSGSATITLTVSDGAASTTDTFVLTVDAVNDAPTISNVTNQQTNEDTATSALAVTLGDVETAVANLDLSGSSSNTTLVPDANIVLGGTGASRTVTVTPASNESGSATITLTVSDGTASTTDTFVLTVGGVNDVPTISDVANQATNEDTATGELAVTLGDEETAAADLTLSVSSSAQGLVPDANIVLGGTGASRTVTVTPASNQSGSATITLTVSDGTASSTDTFVLTVDAVNDAPTISDVSSLSTNEDTATSALAVTLGDEETAVADLTLSTSSSAQGLVPDANIVLGGTGASRTVTVTPASNQSGSATITLTVSDGTASTTDTFVLTVDAVNDVPTISDVANQATNEDTATGALAVTLGDEETAAADLTLSASSSAQGLVPDANIVLGGTGASRTVTVTPASNQSGSATITLTVSDGTASSTDTFVLTVDAVNDAPTISDVSSLSTNEDTATSALAVTLGDAETAVADLTLSRAAVPRGLCRMRTLCWVALVRVGR